MKKIYCDLHSKDFVSIDFDGEYAELSVWRDGEPNFSYLSPDKIRKLRKQLKKALLQIEGNSLTEDDDWFSKGRIVEITGNKNSHYFPIGELVMIDYMDKVDSPFARCKSLCSGASSVVMKSDCKPYKEDEA